MGIPTGVVLPHGISLRKESDSSYQLTKKKDCFHHEKRKDATSFQSPASLLSNTHVTTPLIPFIFMTLKAFISPPLRTFKIMFKLYGMEGGSSRIMPLSTWSVSLPPFICSCSHLEIMWFSLTRPSSGFGGQAQLCLIPFYLPQPVF